MLAKRLEGGATVLRRWLRISRLRERARRSLPARRTLHRRMNKGGPRLHCKLAGQQPRMLTTPRQTTALAGFSSRTAATSDVTTVSDAFARKLFVLSLLCSNVNEAW